MSEKVFSEYAHYYDLLYRDKDYVAETDYIHRIIQQYQPETRMVLELGSGTGKHATLLADRNYILYGVELSEEMLIQAQLLSEKLTQNNPPRTIPKFLKGDIRTVRLGKTFDSVISLFHVISYQTTNADLAAAFQTARIHLKTGGLFIFDVWYGPAVLTERPAVRIKRMADEQIEVTRLAEPVLRPNDNIVEVNYHVFIRNKATSLVIETQEKHHMRYFFQTEIAMLAEHAGFQIEHGEEWLTGNSLGIGTWGACFVLRAS